MAVLHLLRHAKSSWSDDVADHDRPLNRRGCEAARLIGADLPAAMPRLDLVLCSSARRARETMQLAIAGFSLRPAVSIDENLYLAPPERLVDCLLAVDDGYGEVLVIGHNPGLHELACRLAAPDSPRYGELAEGKFPTAARASLRLAGSWSALHRSQHQLIDYAAP